MKATLLLGLVFPSVLALRAPSVDPSVLALRAAKIRPLERVEPTLDRRAVLSAGAAAALFSTTPTPALAVEPPPEWVTAALPPCTTGQNGACVAPAKFDDKFFSSFKDAAGGSGLRFKIYQEGSGPKPVTGQKVFIDYAGYLLDGTPFDASKEGQPFKFRLGKGKVIDGWEGTVPAMQVGTRLAVSIPPFYAYGDKKVGPIPPDSTLLFFMELKELGSIKD